MKRKIKSTINKLFGKSLLKIIEADNTYSCAGVELAIPIGVFHPKYFTSSKLLMSVVEEAEISNKHILELGCGSGIASFLASKKGAIVTASDISELAISNLKSNQVKNGVTFSAVVSDLFDSISANTFDYILINPPFYPKNASSEKEHAWYCGEDFNYFKKLFLQLNERNITSGVFMTLSDDCEFETIKAIATAENYRFREIKAEKNVSETNYLYEISATDDRA